MLPTLEAPTIDEVDLEVAAHQDRPTTPLRWRPSRSACITSGIGALAAVLYTWSLSSVGYANAYYAAAVKSATVSWKALFFGSLDPGSFITVDKPPAAIWLQGLSGRIFGFSSWSMLLPEAAAGVGSVLILHHLVRRWRGDTAAHLAALAFALTPISVAMFRDNNPDALLTFLGLAAAWAMWDAVERGRTRSLVVAAVLTGIAFDTKMLQAFLVVPAFILVYLVAGPPKLGRRIAQLAIALGALIVSAGWWMVAVLLWPSASRPYIGSTTDNSIVSLLLGYNGLDRVFGAGGGTGGGGPGGAGFGGSPGWLRMFDSEVGGQVSWLIPLALAGLVAGVWLTRKRPRTDLTRAGWLLWGGWAFTCLAVFSLSRGIFHPYYTVQLAPAVAALAGAGGLALWQLGRTHRAMQWALPVVIAASAAWAVALLDRTPSYHSGLRTVIVVVAAIAIAGLLVGTWLRERTAVLVAAGLAGAALLAGPAAYAVTTITSPVSGSLVAAGPSTGGFGFGRGFGGGPGRDVSVDTALVSYLEANQGHATYLVATLGSQSSAPIIIATGKPVITIGGFNGGDPAPTLAQFEQLVQDGKVRFLLVDGRGFGGGPGGRGTSSAITEWATTHGTPVQLAGSGANGTLYDLSGAAA